jgi:hypothetical protein
MLFNLLFQFLFFQKSNLCLAISKSYIATCSSGMLTLLGNGKLNAFPWIRSSSTVLRIVGEATVAQRPKIGRTVPDRSWAPPESGR